MLSFWYQLYTKQTAHEQRLEKHVCCLGVRYRTQHIVLSCNAFLDFYFPDHLLAVEVDDPSHSNHIKVQKDIERTEKLNKKGISVIRYTNAQVEYDIDYVIASIENHLMQRTNLEKEKEENKNV